jgi:hypothetical protein
VLIWEELKARRRKEPEEQLRNRYAPVIRALQAKRKNINPKRWSKISPIKQIRKDHRKCHFLQNIQLR